MTSARRYGALFGALLALCGCRSKPAGTNEASLGALTFPVVVIHDGRAITMHRTREDLLVMGVQRAISRQDDPVLVDAGFRVFSLANLRSAKSGGGLMLGGGAGRTPVAFDLAARPELSGLEAARRLILACKYLALADPDLDERRRRDLAQQTTMAGIVDVLTRD